LPATNTHACEKARPPQAATTGSRRTRGRFRRPIVVCAADAPRAAKRRGHKKCNKIHKILLHYYFLFLFSSNFKIPLAYFRFMCYITTMRQGFSMP
jgi:hypothetical protein